MPYNPGMAAPESKHRRFQFGLRTLFVVVTVCCIGLGWIGWQVNVVQSRKALLEWISGSSGFVTIDDFAKPARVSWIRRLLGDHEITGIELLDSTDPTQLDRIKSAFPEAQVRLWHEMPEGGFF